MLVRQALTTAVGIALLGAVVVVADAAPTSTSPADMCAGVTPHPNRVNQTQRALRPFWLHVPKCGTIFGVALLQVHCPEANVTEPLLRVGPVAGSATCVDRFSRLRDGHGGHREQYLTEMVSMLRDPLERITSGYLHDFHDCTPMRIKYCGSKDTKTCNTPPIKVLDEDPDTVLHYAKCVEGLTTKMLNGDNAPTRPFRSPTLSDALAAAHRLETAAFVGIQEEWRTSICLYRAMFGEGGLSAVAFGSARPSKYPQAKEKVRKLLKDANWSDASDTLVYQAAVHRFASDTRRYLAS